MVCFGTFLSCLHPERCWLPAAFLWRCSPPPLSSRVGPLSLEGSLSGSSESWGPPESPAGPSPDLPPVSL